MICTSVSRSRPPPDGVPFMAASLLGLGLPIAGFMAHLIAAQLSGDACLATTRRYARRIAPRRPPGERRYVVLGHTHHPEACAWSGERSRVVYLNPGAWQSHPEGLPRGGKDGPSFVWLARHAGGAAYVRHRIFTLGAVSR